MPFSGQVANKPTKPKKKITAEQLQTLKRCSTDLAYFASFLKLTKRGTPIAWRDYQFRDFELCQNFPRMIHKWCRQSGKRLFEAAYILWYLTFYSSKVCMVNDVKLSYAKKTLNLVKAMHASLPKWLQKPAKFNKLYATFGEGIERCMLLVGTYVAHGCRGRSINLLVCHDFAWVKESVANDYVASIFPTMASGNVEAHRILIASTPGINDIFKHLWENSVIIPYQTPDNVRNMVGTSVTYEGNVIKYSHINARLTVDPETYRREYECEFVPVSK